MHQWERQLTTVSSARQSTIATTLELLLRISSAGQGTTAQEEIFSQQRTALWDTSARWVQQRQSRAPTVLTKMNVDGTTARFAQQAFTALGLQVRCCALLVGTVLLELAPLQLCPVAWAFSTTPLASSPHQNALLVFLDTTATLLVFQHLSGSVPPGTTVVVVL